MIEGHAQGVEFSMPGTEISLESIPDWLDSGATLEHAKQPGIDPNRWIGRVRLTIST
jgi:hypothetical protein